MITRTSHQKESLVYSLLFLIHYHLGLLLLLLPALDREKKKKRDNRIVTISTDGVRPGVLEIQGVARQVVRYPRLEGNIYKKK